MLNVKKCTNLSVVKAIARYSSNYQTFHDILEKSKNIVAVTGAGISAESGLPVFRGAGGLWKTHRSVDLATPQAFEANPSLVWQFYHHRREMAFKCYPNAAHYALATYEQKCLATNRRLTVVTQNVDGLHGRAGSANVIELHGALRKVKCTKCKRIDVNTDRPICEALSIAGEVTVGNVFVETKDLPACRHCDGLLRPHVVWFGEQLEADVLDRARSLIESCDLCLIIGTSSLVYPAAMFAPSVAARGKPVAEFNLDESPPNEDFAFYFGGKCTKTVPKALRCK